MKDGQAGDTGEAMLVDGIIAGTRIATDAGWRAVETLSPGDAVLTLEGGYQRLVGLRSFRFSQSVPPPVTWPLIVPRGALDCREPMLLMPEQQVLIECDQAERLFGDALALIPALALEGLRGIKRIRPRSSSEAVALTFAMPHMVYASRAVLLACHAFAGAPPRRRTNRPRRPALDGRPLSREQAFHLVACLMAEDVGAAIRAIRP